MAETKNVSLTGHLAEFVARNVASGSFQNASEVVREGLRLLERQQRDDGLRFRLGLPLRHPHRPDRPLQRRDDQLGLRTTNLRRSRCPCR